MLLRQFAWRQWRYWVRSCWSMKRPKAKRSKVWLHFTSKELNSATCNRCNKVISSKGGNTTNLTKHLTTHSVYLKAEKCTVFDHLRDARPSTSAAQAGQIKTPSPAGVVVDNTDDDESDSHSTHSSLSTSGKSSNLMTTANLEYKVG